MQKNNLTNTAESVYTGSTISNSGLSAPVSSGFFVSFFKTSLIALWRVKRAEYNTRKGNKPRRLFAVVETRRLIMSAKLLNEQEATMPKQASPLKYPSVPPAVPGDTNRLLIDHMLDHMHRIISLVKDLDQRTFDTAGRIMHVENYLEIKLQFIKGDHNNLGSGNVNATIKTQPATKLKLIK